jgi:hypothetical protein
LANWPDDPSHLRSVLISPECSTEKQIENSAIALENAHLACAAAVQSRNYQQQLLQAEIDKFAVGATNFTIFRIRPIWRRLARRKSRPAPTG